MKYITPSKKRNRKKYNLKEYIHISLIVKLSHVNEVEDSFIDSFIKFVENQKLFCWGGCIAMVSDWYIYNEDWKYIPNMDSFLNYLKSLNVTIDDIYYSNLNDPDHKQLSQYEQQYLKQRKIK
jgi:hypothetical protein